MTKLLRNSLLWQLWLLVKRLFRDSLVCTLLRKLWRSRLANACRRTLAKPPTAERSALNRRLSGFNRRLYGLGQRLTPRTEGSLFVRALRWLRQKLQQSLLLGWLFQDGLHTLVLTVLGLFGILDWLLRDVLTVPVFSSFWDEGLLLLGMLLVIWERISAKTPIKARCNVQTLPMLQFFAVSLLLFVLTLGNRADISVTGLRATCQSILWFPVLLRLLRDERDVHRLYLCMILAAFVISLHGIYQYIAAVPIPSNWTDHAEQSVRTRVFSIFGSPNIMGDFMLLFAPMTLAMAYYVTDRRKKLLFVAMTACMGLGCLFTMSRGAWVGLFLAIVVFALLSDLRLLLAIGAAGVLSLAIPFVSSRILYLFSGAFAASTARGGRQIRWEKALKYLNNYGDPWLGLGFGRFGGAVAMQNQINSSWDYFYVDNYYVKILAENGYLGLGSYLLMMLGLLWSGFRGWYANRRTGYRPLISGMFAGLCGVLAHCYFENIFEEPYMLVYFWCIAAMMVFLGMHGRKKTGKE